MEQIKEIAKMLEQLEFPARPTKNQLLLYEQVICKTCKLHKNPEVLVLGATPELRDLCIKHRCKVMAVSPGRQALEAMTYLMKYKHHPYNTAIESNWLNMPLADTSYDLALTDIALTGNPRKNHEPILQEVHRLLKPSGFFFLRSYDMLEHETKPKPLELLAKWRSGELCPNDFIYLSPRISLEKNHDISQAKNLALLKEYIQNNILTEEEIRHLRPYASKGTLSCPYREDLIKAFSKFFENVTVQCAKDPKFKTVEQDALFFMTKASN